MTKSLVEELREVRGCYDLARLVNGEDFKCNYTCNSCHNKLTNAFADRIEREYLERPRFEDGEPVQFGDECLVHLPEDDFCGEVSEISYSSEGYMIKDIDAEIVYLPFNERVKRPQTEEKDSLERIKADALKPYGDYWKCRGVDCSCCPSKIEGKTPEEHYGAENCAHAACLDLIERTARVMEACNE